MDREKELLKQDLNKQETTEEINKFIEDAELMGGHEDIVELAKQKLQEISVKADTIGKTSESQISQVENIGGSKEEIDNRTGEVDKKIEEVKTEAIKEVEAVKNEEEEIKNTTADTIEVSEEQKQQAEKIKELDSEMNKLLEEIISNLPNKITEVVNSEPYKRLSALNEKRKTEEKALFDIYERYTKGRDDSHHRAFSTHNLDGYTGQYTEDLKHNGASNDIIKRFEDFVEKYRKPELQAENDYSEVYRKNLNETRWDFEKNLVSKSEEIFGKDRASAEEFKKKYYNSYRENFSKTQNATIQDRPLNFNTVGKIYS